MIDVGSPSEAGWDVEALQAFVEWCEEYDTHQLIVVRDDRAIVEHYGHGADRNTTFDVGSVQKSVIWSVVGNLVAQGELDLDAPMSTWLGTGWTKASPTDEATILLRHVLSMSTGLDDDFVPEAAPGTVWYYNNNAYHQVRKAIETVTHRSCQEVCAELVFDPIGMTRSVWEPRPETFDPAGCVLSALHTTALDLARFGTAVLAAPGAGPDLGFTADYVAASWTASQDLNPSYGYLWWVLAGERAIVPGVRRGEASVPGKAFGGIELPRPLAPSAPRDTVMGLGTGDHRIHLVPSHRLVVVRLGGPVRDRTVRGTVDEKMWRRLAPALPAVGEGA